MMFSVVFKFLVLLAMTSQMSFANVQRYQKIISSSYANGSRYGVVNWIKEYFYYNQGTLGPIAGAVEDVVLLTGVKNYTGLNEKMLARNTGSTVEYILGRKYFDGRQFSNAITAFSKVSRASKFFPQAQYHLAVSYYLKRDNGNALLHFDNCQKEANSMRTSSDDENVNKQYKLVMDLCQVESREFSIRSENMKQPICLI
jgi:hypothetical protein